MTAIRKLLGVFLLATLAGFTPGCATALPCLPGEPSVNCCLKKFPLTPEESCGVPAAKALTLLQAMEMAAESAREEAEEAEEAEEQVSSAAPEPPDCKGQEHHVISRRIARALEDHQVLRGMYQPRDERFVAQARDEQAHCGYQQWHRDVDREVIAWLQRQRNATPKEFEAFLRDLYNRSALRERFPHGF